MNLDLGDTYDYFSFEIILSYMLHTKSDTAQNS